MADDAALSRKETEDGVFEVHPKEGGIGSTIWITRNDGINFEGEYKVLFRSTDTSKTSLHENAIVIKPNVLSVTFSGRELPDWSLKKAFMNFKVQILKSGSPLQAQKSLNFTWSNFYVVTKTQKSVMKILAEIYPSIPFLPVLQKDIDDFNLLCLGTNVEYLKKTLSEKGNYQFIEGYFIILGALQSLNFISNLIPKQPTENKQEKELQLAIPEISVLDNSSLDSSKTLAKVADDSSIKPPPSPTESTSQVEKFAGVISHNIPHVLDTTSLLIPVVCTYCEKFIWGSKQAIHCIECSSTWHVNCQKFVTNDCGLTSRMMANAFAKTSGPLSVEMKRSNTLTSKGDFQKDEELQIGSHFFKVHNYRLVGFCKHCGGWMAKGVRCEKCFIDCHSRCLNQLTRACIEEGGQLPVADLDDDTKLDEESNRIAEERRSNQKTNQVPFKKGKESKSTRKGKKNIFGWRKGKNEKEEEPEPEDENEVVNREPEVNNTQSAPSTQQTQKQPPVLPHREDEDFSNLQFEDFEILDKQLGSGQFSIVKKGILKKNNLPVAVKIIEKKRFLEKPESLRFLQRETEILTNTKHPNVIRVYAISDQQNAMYIFMELIEGGDLLGYVERKGSLEEDEAKFLFHQILVGIKFLHSKEIVHRDLKPENILLSAEDGVMRIKIADFGFANFIDKTSFLVSIVGTPAYVAPEVVNKRVKGYREAVDLWSLGVMMYACLGGVFPFDEGEPVEEQIKSGKFYFPNEFFGQISNEAIDLCCRMLVVNPKARITAAEALQHRWFLTTSSLKL